MDDRRAMRDIYLSVVLAWIIAMAWTLALRKPWIALSITLGTLLSGGLLAGLDCVIRRAFVPGAQRPMRALWRLGLVKYPVLGALLYALARCDKINLIALCGGVVLVHFAIVAKTIGFMFVERLAAGKAYSAGLASTEGRDI